MTSSPFTVSVGDSVARYVVSIVLPQIQKEMARHLAGSRKDPSDTTRQLLLSTWRKHYPGRCPCCGGVTKEEMLVVDHWYHVSENALNQLWVVCTDCNRRLGPAGSIKREGFRERFVSFQFVQRGDSGLQLAIDSLTKNR